MKVNIPNPGESLCSSGDVMQRGLATYQAIGVSQKGRVVESISTGWDLAYGVREEVRRKIQAFSPTGQEKQ